MKTLPSVLGWVDLVSLFQVTIVLVMLARIVGYTGNHESRLECNELVGSASM